MKKLRALGVKRPSAAIPHSDDYLELTNQKGGQKRSADQSESESKMTYSVV